MELLLRVCLIDVKYSWRWVCFENHFEISCFSKRESSRFTRCWVREKLSMIT